MKRLFNHEPYGYDDDTLKQVHRGVLGAIIGDIIGSRLEFKRNKEYNFELFTDANDFTDDTVMTIAVADWLTRSETRPVGNDTLPDIMRSWGRKHLWRGYGGMFHRWLVSEYEEDQRPYNSFGNAAAYYSVPDKIARKALEYLPEEMVEVLKEFASVVSNNKNK